MKTTKIIKDQKKAERVHNSVKLKQFREYERKRKAEQRKRKLLNKMVLDKMEERHLGKELEELT